MHGALESVGWTIGESLELEMEGLDPRGGGGGLRFQRLPQVREPGGSHLPSSAYLTTLVDVFKIRWRAWRGDYDTKIRT